MAGEGYDPFRGDTSEQQSPPDNDDFPEASDDRDEYVANPDEVPSGSAKEVLDWVGDDKDRAQRAYDAEQAKDEPRKGLSSDLEDLLKN